MKGTGNVRRDRNSERGKGLLFFTLAVLLFISLPRLFSGAATAGFIDMGIWHVILLALISWGMVMGISIVIFNNMLSAMNLAGLDSLTVHFNDLSLWQKYMAYAFLYCLILGAGIGCLLAIC